MTARDDLLHLCPEVVRTYADPATYLYTPTQWAPRRDDYCRLVGKPTSGADALAQGKEEPHSALEELEATPASASPDDTGTVRLDPDDHLVCRRCRPRTSPPRP